MMDILKAGSLLFSMWSPRGSALAPQPFPRVPLCSHLMGMPDFPHSSRALSPQRHKTQTSKFLKGRCDVHMLCQKKKKKSDGKAGQGSHVSLRRL